MKDPLDFSLLLCSFSFSERLDRYVWLDFLKKEEKLEALGEFTVVSFSDLFEDSWLEGILKVISRLGACKLKKKKDLKKIEVKRDLENERKIQKEM